jgi:hypothetical protein
MKILKLSVSVFLTLLMISCTSEKPTSTAQSESSANRGPASVGAKRKMKGVKVPGKGFLIPKKYIRRLPQGRQMTYYNIFVRASHDLNRFVQKKARGASIDNIDQYLLELFFEPAYAELCTSSLFAFNISGNCTLANSNFFPQDQRADWQAYGPGAWAQSGVDVCRNNGNRPPCPHLGLRAVGTQVQILCGETLGTASRTCRELFDSADPNVGSSVTQRIRRRCSETGDRESGFTNVTCADIEAADTNYINMHQRNCTGAARATLPTFARGICDRIGSAVGSIRSEIEQPRDPANESTSLPNIASCRYLEGEQARGVEGDVSPHWQSLMQLARQRCGGRVGGQSEFQLANNFFGRCTQPFPGNRNRRELTNLVNNYDGNHRNRSYQETFIQTFGITPDSFEAIFCVNEPGQFLSNLTPRRDGEANQRVGLDGHIDTAREQLYRFVGFQDRADSNPFARYSSLNELTNNEQERLYGLMQNWLGTNDTQLSNVSRGFSTVDELRGRVSQQNRQEALGYLFAAFREMQRQNPRGTARDLDSFILSQFPDNTGNLRQAELRAALAESFRGLLASPEHEQALSDAQSWLSACRDQVLESQTEFRNIRQNGESAVGQVTTFNTNTRNCGYVRVDDVEAYAENPNNDPLVILDQSDRNNPQCLKVDEGEWREAVRGTSAITTVTAYNPMPGQRNTTERQIELEGNLFQNSASSNRPLALFRLTGCDRDELAPGVPGYRPPPLEETEVER